LDLIWVLIIGLERIGKGTLETVTGLLLIGIKNKICDKSNNKSKKWNF